MTFYAIKTEGSIDHTTIAPTPEDSISDFLETQAMVTTLQNMGRVDRGEETKPAPEWLKTEDEVVEIVIRETSAPFAYKCFDPESEDCFIFPSLEKFLVSVRRFKPIDFIYDNRLKAVYEDGTEKEVDLSEYLVYTELNEEELAAVEVEFQNKLELGKQFEEKFGPLGEAEKKGIKKYLIKEKSYTWKNHE